MNSTKLKKYIPVILCDETSKHPFSLAKLLRKSDLDFTALSFEQIRVKGTSLCNDSENFLPILLSTASFERSHQLVTTLRGASKSSPLIVAQEGLSSPQRTLLLRSGCDDAITTPTDVEEITARVEAVRRRSNNIQNPLVKIGDVTVDLNNGFADISGESLNLTTKESAILQLLALRGGRLVTRQTVYNTIYAFADNLPFEKAIDVHIFNLRKKMDSCQKDSGRKLKTVSGQGFILTE